MIKDFFTNLFSILAFLFIATLILSKCTPEETERLPIKQQPAQNIETEKEEKDILEDAKRNAEFWTMMIPAL